MKGKEIRVFLTLALLALGGARGAQKKEPLANRKPPESGSRVHIISSSHQDIAWMNSPQACVEYRDTQVITPALEMMAKNPDYCFVMENMLNLQEYLERHPDRRDEILRFTREGRMEWGATFNQPYESLLTGEQLVRQTYFGRRWLKKNFPGCDAKVYFNPDVPGRAVQMQQILAKAGIPYMVISRYHEGLYRWESPDGSGVISYSPGHYTNPSAILAAPPAEGVKALEERLARWSPYHETRGIPPKFPLLHSVDFSKPTDFGPLISLWNSGHAQREGRPGSTMRYSSAREFFESIEDAHPDLDTVAGERPNLWLYIHGPTHHWAISAQREAGNLLPAAEIFSTALSLLQGGFKDYPARRLENAWLAAIYPDHGWGGKEGQVTDRLFRKKYEFARDEGRAMLVTALGRLADRIDTPPGKGIPVVIFNSLSWKRTATVMVAVPGDAGRWRVHDARGDLVASQPLPGISGREGDGRLEFIARDIPPLGYKTFYLVKGKTAAQSTSFAPPSPSVHENSFYRIEFAAGGLKSVFDKELGQEILDTGKFLGFEVFTMQSVGNGAGEFGRVQQPTMEGFDKLSLHEPSWSFAAAESGLLKKVWSLSVPLENARIEEKITVYAAIKRIDCEVSILGWDGLPYREFRLALPVRATAAEVAYEVPMGVVEVGKSEIPGTGGPAYGNLNYDEVCSQIRPREVGRFISASGPDFGLTLSTDVAVNDFKDPTPDPGASPLLQPVLLASRRSCHGEGNWYLQEGDHHYHFSILSHAPGWRNGYRRGMEGQTPLFAVVKRVERETWERAALPEEMSFFNLSAPGVLVSTIKKAEDDDTVIIRLYEIEGKDSEVELSSSFPFSRAALVNIIEEEGSALPLRAGSLKLKVGHQAIETVRLWPNGEGRK